MFDTLQALAAQAELLVLSVAGVIWLGGTIAIGVMRRSILGASGWFIVGAFLMYGMWNSDYIQQRVGEDVQQTGAPVIVEFEASWTSTSS